MKATRIAGFLEKGYAGTELRRIHAIVRHAHHIENAASRHYGFASPSGFRYENERTFSSMNCITQIEILLRAKSAPAADFVSATKFISPTRSRRAVMCFAAENSLRHARRAMRSGRPYSAESARIYIQPDKIIAAIPQARSFSKPNAAARAPRARFGSSPAIKNHSSGVKFRRFSCARGQIRRGAPAELFYRFSQRRVRPHSLRSVC